MDAIVFTVVVFSIHPSYDHQGVEYICVEFGYKPPRMPTMMPTSMSREVSDMIEAGKSIIQVAVPPQIQSQLLGYANRLVIFLTPDEWGSLQRRYTVGDEFKVMIKPEGSILVAET